MNICISSAYSERKLIRQQLISKVLIDMSTSKNNSKESSDPNRTRESDDATMDSYSQTSSFPGSEAYAINPIKESEPHDLENGKILTRRTSTRASVSQTFMSLAREITNPTNRDEKLYNEQDLPKMGSGKKIPPIPANEEEYLVTFDMPDDPVLPHNWSIYKKILLTSLVTTFSFCNSLGSALLSQSTEEIMKKFSIGREVATLATSLYVLGFAFGPILWGPLSEIYGRKGVFVPATFGYTCFSFAVATAENIQTIMICRFFCGFFGASSMVLSSATIADLFSSEFRGRAMAPFGVSVCGGPTLAPIISGFTAKNSHLSWRWNAYWNSFIGSLIFGLMVFFFEETYHPVILVKKAANLRKMTGNWGIHCAHEKLSLSFRDICVKFIARPILMLLMEPIIFLIALYGAFVYGLIYLLLEAIPLIFTDNYKFSLGVGELPYISVFIGVLIGGGILTLADVRYRKLAMGGKSLPRERLPAMMVGGFCISIGMFWLTWSGDYPLHVHWIVPTIGGAFVGAGFLTVFQPCINYIVDSYLAFAASGVTAITILRSIFGGVFPLFSYPMFTKMLIKYAGTLIGCVSVLLIPVPFIFYHFDAKLRKKSHFILLS